jgi:hypothetical protein
MHRGHDHHHHEGGSAGASGHARPGPGHNRGGGAVAQWQAPHLGDAQRADAAPREPDLDQVELAFTEGFAAAADPTSFLRLAAVPFEAVAADGEPLVLLRVEIDLVTDVGGITPHLGGASFRYDPLPARMVTRRRRLRFIYRGERGLRPLGFAEVRALA